MPTIDELKEKLRRRIIELDGHAGPTDLADIIDEARELGMNEEQIARMGPEADRSINWEHIRLQKQQAAEQALIEAERQARRQEEIDGAPEYLNALISYCMADGIVEAEELRVIFDKAAGLEQSLHAVAVKIKGLLDKGRFRPHPNADLNANGLHEVLMSTSWYTDKMHPRTQHAQAGAAQAAPPQAPLHIVTFSVDKPQIKKGQYAKLSWNVSGKGKIHISNLGSTEKLSGEQLVRPQETTQYVLTAGNERRAVGVVVKPASGIKTFFKVIICAIGAFMLLGILVAVFNPDSGRSNVAESVVVQADTTGPSQLSVGQIGAVGITASEESAIVEAMNRYLQYQNEDYQTPEAIRGICKQYAYPVTRYFTQRNASFEFVYKDAMRYRQKFKPDVWKLVPEDTKVERTPEGDFRIDLEGMFSYYIRNPKSGDGHRERYVHNRYVMNREFKISSVYEVK